MELLVTALRREAEGVLGVELRHPAGAPLPAFVPGAHVDVAFPNGCTRQYSIASSAGDGSRYWLGIGLAPASRGGSRYAHERLRPGDRLQVGAPRALFQLDADAAGHLFIAGGIGITPILSMIRWCIDHQRSWRLLYCVRSRRHAAYLETLAPHAARCRLHADDEQGGPADLHASLRELPAGWHVYCCGPGAMMDAVSAGAGAAGVPAPAVHFERFAPPSARGEAAEGGEGAEGAGPADGAFEVALARQGGRFTVPAGQSILSVLEGHGLCLPSSCREGLCRSCEVPLLAGRADHRDYVLSEAEREANRSILICVSRAAGGELVLDL
ncbi:oxidoreductase [Cupriavidus sp. USMAA2-4]|uniref:PDR/VanB family oxidoreductase n=1 Tax=unclassified Cupriavidus TaxID=2640874 RepID=UPI0008A6978C|nr:MULTISPECIES: PDR/VanB family oxidoreductase [unclassified Cupriavidus]AOY94547.1 oxidoreductase [Cupriavidus sp. USMAA2-4]AOZ02600.1 oxidoreductase [Cupriavidus sp. USMAHM13]